jgi:phosphate transport system substrate-binding protein
MIRYFAAALALFASFAHAQEAQTIRGAGATFPAEVYSAWAFGYSKEKKTPLQYQPVGSGEGIKRIVSRQVDFGASDDPMPAADLQKNGLIQFPTLVGGLVPAFNLKGIKSGELRLTGAVLAKIFAGQITRWNDPELQALNKTLALPAKPIKRIVREDASGSTRSFTDYLSRHMSGWAAKSGVGFKVDWQGEHLQAKGTKGVTELLKTTEGGITYVSFQEVSRQGLTAPRLQNKDGHFVAPSEHGFLAAIAASPMGKTGDDNVSLIDLSGAETWPLTDVTYVIIPKVAGDVQRTKKVLSFFYWVFAQGDQMAHDTGFVPLPTRLQVRVLSRFREVVGPNGLPVEYLSMNGLRLARLEATPTGF